MIACARRALRQQIVNEWILRWFTLVAVCASVAGLATSSGCTGQTEDSPGAHQNQPPSDSTPPVIVITYPVDGQLISLAGVAITAWADDENDVEKVEFHVDGWEACSDSVGGPLYECHWEPDGHQDDDPLHTIFAIAFDKVGNVGVSNTVVIRISNPCESEEDCTSHQVCYKHECRQECGDTEDCFAGELCVPPPGESEDICVPFDALPTMACESDWDCASDQVCFLFQCRSKCENTKDCLAGEYCAQTMGGGEEICLPLDVPPPFACELDDDCASTQVCYQKQCRNRCDDTEDCLAGEHCAELPGGSEEVCIPYSAPPKMACQLQEDCASNEVCYQYECRDECDNTQDCLAGQYCAQPAGVSDKICIPFDGPSMTACIADNDCGWYEVCYQYQCRSTCNSNDDCLSGELCTEVPGVLEGICVPFAALPTMACEGDGHCATNQVCYQYQCRSECDDTVDCLAGEYCVQPSGESEEICIPFDAPSLMACAVDDDCAYAQECYQYQCRNECGKITDCFAGEFCAEYVCMPVAPCQLDLDCQMFEDASCHNGACCVPQSCSAIGKECGSGWDDGCGGKKNCGGCSVQPNSYCTQSGICLCTPDCGGKECGSDGCGGNCGGCGYGVMCWEGACCVPECGAGDCGSDGCGGQCGLCDETEVCHMGKCKPSCMPTYIAAHAGGAAEVFVEGGIVYVIGTDGTLRAFDVDDPADAQLVGSVSVGGMGEQPRIHVDAGLAWIASGLKGVKVVDVSDLDNFTVVGAWDSPGSGFAKKASAWSKYVVVADGLSGLQVLDASDPAVPTGIGTGGYPLRASRYHILWLPGLPRREGRVRPADEIPVACSGGRPSTPV